MNRRIIIPLASAATLIVASASFSQAVEPRADADVAAEYESEAAQLREKAQSHRKMAKLYRTQTLPKSGGYENVARHCDRLAQSYENAAKEAESVATELSR